MDVEKLRKLRIWRDKQARQEGVEVFRVLSNQTLSDIVLSEATTETALLAVKGIKEKKLAKYGRAILEIMNGKDDVPDRGVDEIVSAGETGEKIFSVSVFLDLVNTGLRTFEVKIKGEVTSVDVRGNVHYFSLKDKEDGSVISCLIWENNYRLAGVELEEGLEVMIHGFPNIYKPTGRLTFQADTIELVGAGALKKQFEELKNKLEKEGLFAVDRKKPIPLFPEKIGLITSRQGEAIFDFRTNLGKFAFQIKFLDSRVEGVQAVPSLIKAVRYFKNTDIDVLVLVRGGGSLESLLSFNNEALVREIADFPKPVICGIGHEQDVSLVDLVADRSCSTPTGAAKLLSYGWEQALAKVLLSEKQIMSSFKRALIFTDNFLERTASGIKDNFRKLLTFFRDLSYRLKTEFSHLAHLLAVERDDLKRLSSLLSVGIAGAINQTNLKLETFAKTIELNDPERQLKLGYSLLFRQGEIVRTVKDVSLGEEIAVQLKDGKIYSEIKKINKR